MPKKEKKPKKLSNEERLRIILERAFPVNVEELIPNLTAPDFAAHALSVPKSKKVEDVYKDYAWSRLHPDSVEFILEQINKIFK